MHCPRIKTKLFPTMPFCRISNSTYPNIKNEKFCKLISNFYFRRSLWARTKSDKYFNVRKRFGFQRKCLQSYCNLLIKMVNVNHLIDIIWCPSVNIMCFWRNNFWSKIFISTPLNGDNCSHIKSLTNIATNIWFEWLLARFHVFRDGNVDILFPGSLNHHCSWYYET